ncbi:TonB-dependent receptor [uncultured Muribaculum sp.]|uniref:SusC/RagA family TonB-linked outer membrane protein n=1 Tax=uncultured Muribaculum sp. TaxID=1918613 RepID=UPI0025AF60D4|nr:TonB-dependent receptor [uncultured Muribaculum sp.]
MKPHVNLNHFSKDLLKVAACLAIGTAISAPVAYAEPLQATQSVQNGTVSGVVTDSQGEPIIGASVIVKGTSEGVATDLDGRFTVKASAGQEISISSIGYKPVTVTVGNSPLNIVLEEDSQMLDDVVVIGYGTQRKGDVTSAVSSIKAEDFTVGAIGDASELVKGKVAGLTISKGTGDPNAESTIRLRGVISLQGGSTPLVLIDGVEGGLGTVPPENIASIDVLKDASAAAIYGTRGANGVILITTKSGSRGEANTTATYSGYVSWASLAKKHKFMTAEQIRQGLTNFSDRGYETDWLDAVSRTAFTHNHDFQISGGNSTTTYSGNVSYRNAEGVIITTFNEELKMNFDISHWFFNDMIKVHLNLVKGIHKNGALNAATEVYRHAIMRNPTEPIYDTDGRPYENLGITYYYNPVGLIEELEGEYKSEWSRLTGDITIEPIKGWQTKLMMSTDRSNAHNAYFRTSDYYSHRTDGKTGDAGHSYSYSQSNNLEVTSNYRQTFDNKHRFDALVGYSYQKNMYEGFNAWNADFNNDFFSYNNLGLGQELKNGKASMGSYKNDDKLIGFFGRVSYGYDNRYNLLLSMRREGSSKFGKNHKWGNFPSASAGWNVMNEEFWKGLSISNWWNELKLRAGYGVTGVIPSSSYQALTRYDFGGGRYFYNNGKWVPGMVVASNPNPDLKWETSHEINVGIDWDMFNGRFGGSVDVYNKTTKDMLWWYDVPVPPNLYPQTLANVGKMRNTGVELLLRGIPVQVRDFEWTTTLTLSHNSNKLISLSNGMYETANQHPSGGLGEPISQSTHRLEVGKPVDHYFGIKSVGVSENGLWMVEDPRTGEAVELNDDMLPDDNMKQDLGNGLPKVYLGWSNTFRYKNFDLSMQFTGQFGFKILNEARAYYENNSINYNRLQSVLEAPYGDRTLAGNQKQTFVSYYLENGDFLKLTNLTFGYTVPLKKNKFVNNIRAYFSAENLFTITKYKGLDPELSNGDATSAGIERRDNYPTVRSFTLGLNINF